mmetsp:Transcript_6095/g.19139  ORF Transcript_6095/g.19139 Transcript_6095/m.19139 type:complete len:141 (+) Transcript_6095:216-638(+)
MQMKTRPPNKKNAKLAVFGNVVAGTADIENPSRLLHRLSDPREHAFIDLPASMSSSTRGPSSFSPGALSFCCVLRLHVSFPSPLSSPGGRGKLDRTAARVVGRGGRKRRAEERKKGPRRRAEEGQGGGDDEKKEEEEERR